MLKALAITNEDILHQVKLSCKIPEIIEQIIARKAIENAAAEAGIKVETEELQKAADQMRFMNQLLNANDTWAWLEKHHLSLDDFEEIVYTTLLAGKLSQHLFADKVEPYFFQQQLDYAGVVMYEVVLDDEDLALELFYAVKEGEMSFYDVARQYIQDVELRRKGGYLGVVRRKDLKAEISAAVFAAKPPQLLKPIVTARGLHLILVEELIQPELNEKLRTNIISNLFSQWLNQQIEQSEISKSP
ncbi:peptidylprolyl isomerase [Microseira wollei]|uniref:peptidylprolyl isomerase n=1 Tax=Microseira wollei NIES-4236 TaxID=2530354 RepID=A0AAV3X2Y3_9CYAN|nr:peptidylprolyl isomerase [Microseira wollei]GET36125.1 PpiC-type peptidyl-prolyl cis-trans isomerase [Microseira wollei NIES-4236]